MKRVVQPELLDELPVQDPRALRSRRDICRLNAVMGNARLVAAELDRLLSRHMYFRLVELGAGDGRSLLRVARRLRGKWRGVQATLVDRDDLLAARTRAAFAGIAWQTSSIGSDVFHWLNTPAAEPSEVIVANLFLHQFEDAPLRELFVGVAGRTRALIAIEPRRGRPALFLSRLVGLLGCNAITRHDAPVSVQAGFAGRELSALWPNHDDWELEERSAGWCSHVFVARRKEKNPDATGLGAVNPPAAVRAPATEIPVAENIAFRAGAGLTRPAES